MSKEEQGKKIGQLIAKCWADESFKQRLMADTNATLKAEGVEIPDGLKVNVFENTNQVYNLVLPQKATSTLSGIDMDHVSVCGFTTDRAKISSCGFSTDRAGINSCGFSTDRAGVTAIDRKVLGGLGVQQEAALH